jgi:hypothetical protein
MHANSYLKFARAVAVLLLVAHFLGLGWFASTLSGYWLLYGFLASAALAVFSLLPRRLLPRSWGPVFVLAVAAIGATVPVAYQDITLVNGADYGALVLRLATVCVFTFMLLETLHFRKGNHADA